ncbi:MAG TPA: hypothetical protein VH684_21610 [Xanthobacteraceae bacterium]|jgi:hypothetical protein
MALDIDGFAVLRSIGEHPNTFPSIAGEAAKIARGLVVKQLKARASNLKSMRDICAALGAHAFDLILDGLTDDQVKSLVAKIDKHHPDLKMASPEWRLQRVRTLAHGTAEPVEKQRAAAKSTKLKVSTQQPPAPERLGYMSAGAKRRR